LNSEHGDTASLYIERKNTMLCCLYYGEYGSEMTFSRIKILGGKYICKKCKELMDFDRKDSDRLPKVVLS
jgi:hypothetical protein